MATTRPKFTIAQRHAAQRVISDTRGRGDSDLTVLRDVLTSLRAGCDPTGTNDSWNAAFILVDRQDKRETRLKPSLRPGYRPKHRAAKKAPAQRRGARKPR